MSRGSDTSPFERSCQTPTTTPSKQLQRSRIKLFIPAFKQCSPHFVGREPKLAANNRERVIATN